MQTIAPAMSRSFPNFPGIGNRADWARAQTYFLASLDRTHIEDPLESVITAIKIYPYDPAFYCQSAHLRLLRAEVAHALDDVNLAISMDPHSSRSWCVYGNVLTSKGDFNGAVEALETSVKLGPTNAEAWHSLGFGYSLLHEDNKAEQALNKCLRVIAENKHNANNDPFHSDDATETHCLIELGGLKKQRGALTEARLYFLKAKDSKGGGSYGNLIQDLLDKVNIPDKAPSQKPYEMI